MFGHGAFARRADAQGEREVEGACTAPAISCATRRFGGTIMANNAIVISLNIGLAHFNPIAAAVRYPDFGERNGAPRYYLTAIVTKLDSSSQG